MCYDAIVTTGRNEDTGDEITSKNTRVSSFFKEVEEIRGKLGSACMIRLLPIFINRTRKAALFLFVLRF